LKMSVAGINRHNARAVRKAVLQPGVRATAPLGERPPSPSREEVLTR